MRQKRNKKQQGLNCKGFLSLLPDEILVVVLDKLKVQEAARTCILSTRWRYLWTFRTGSVLTIDGSKIMPWPRRKKNWNFVDTAYEILRKIKAQTVDELQIIYPDYIGDKFIHNDLRHVDDWISVVIQRQVKTLILHFDCPRFDPIPKWPIEGRTMVSLVTLRMRSASLSGELIDCLLSNSPNLEELSIKWSNGHLEHVKISGPSLKLKHLELIGNYIHNLEISAPNLVKFNHFCKRRDGTRIYFKAVPLLTELSYKEMDVVDIQYGYTVLLPQLESFTLSLSAVTTAAAQIPAFSVLKNLKQMKLSFGRNFDGGLELFFRLFAASPFLRRVSLDLGISQCPEIKHELIDGCSEHECLEEIEIDDFCGCDNEVQLVMCIAQFSPMMKKIVIRPWLSKVSRCNGGANIVIKEDDFERVVQNMQSRLPQIEMVILRDAITSRYLLD